MSAPNAPLAPRRAIAAYCAWCSRGAKAVRLCPAADCALHAFRLGRRGPGQDRGPLPTIRLRCMACSESAAEVRQCQDAGCPLHPYRMGKNPARAGLGPASGPTAARNPDSTAVLARETSGTAQDTPQGQNAPQKAGVTKP
jgi:hypothetical protein